MRTFDFSCAYVRSADEEAGSSCGRRATRRRQGEPKCLGHWVVEYLLSIAGGTEHARKTWAFASFVLFILAVGSPWWLRTVTLPHAIAAVVLSGGLLACFLWEHPLGGIACLVSATLTAPIWARGSAFKYYLFNPEAEIPAGSTRARQLLVTSLELQVAFVFTFSVVGFAILYFFNSRSETKFWRGLSFALGILLFLSVMVLAVATSGRSTALVPWLVVVFAAVAVARGGRFARKLAAILRV
ncbi:hypothetical protein B0I31_104145 [Saccharothrix carnea]|uniref:Uncharacterized protein n=1 Tax=Saccharothrix carnea TaxID=1280637 RepID=A0A2P8IBK9_SACCR|nr:hypothetical protein [Saccharothrix carnea]PSL55854.1 hypothetical protein B0I31_104145 [Saccharothrix carnea]